MAADTASVPPDVRRVVLRAFTKKRHLQVQSDAVQFVFDTLQDHGLLDEPAAADEAVDALAAALVDQHTAGAQLSGFDGSVVTRAALQKVYNRLLVESADGTDGAAAALTQGDAPNLTRFFAVCDAFEQPWIRYHAGRKVFERVEQPRTLLSSAQASSTHLAERYELLKSIVLRNEHFLPALTGAAAQRDAFMHLTTTKNLLGRQDEACLLFGRLSTAADGTYILEDTEGTVPLDLTQAVAGEGLFTEGAFVLVEGTYTRDERLQVLALGHPPSENRDAARTYTGHLDWHGTGAVPAKHVAALRAQEAQHPDVSIAVLSDVHLDDPATRSRLRAILQGYQDADFVPLAIVLCGHFSSRPLEADGALDALTGGFAALADILLRFPRILEACHFVFVPGPKDPAATPLLPRPRIPAPLVAGFERRLPADFVQHRLHWMSNPCRLVYFSQEIVVFRDDCMSKMLRSAVLLKDHVTPSDLQKYLVSTLLDQAHLAPLPPQVRPVLWDYASTLSLYPMPSALVLADRYERFELTYEGCHVFNPGSFRAAQSWTTYYPATGHAERSVSAAAAVPPAALRDTIAVRGLEVRAQVGVDLWGRAKPQPIQIDAVLRTDVARAADNDALQHTHNYGTLYRALEALGADPAPRSLAQWAEYSAKACLHEVGAPWAEIELRLPRAVLRAQHVAIRLTRTPASFEAPHSAEAQALRDADVVHLHGIDAVAILGVNACERVERQHIVLHLDAWPAARAAKSYAALATYVADAVERSSFLTIESLVTHLARELLQRFALEQVRVRADKPSAILHAQCSSVDVTRDRTSLQLEPLPAASTAVIALGSNLGDRVAHFSSALQLLNAHPDIDVVDTSFLYETAPMYYEDQPRFLNGACKVRTTLAPLALLDVCQAIETQVGRVKEHVPRNGPRVIDLDVIAIDDLHLETERLIVPHARLAERAFALYPLCDVWPDYVHPVLGRAAHTLLPGVDTTGMVRVHPLGAQLEPWGAHTRVMGILNATPDSFSDGGQHAPLNAAMQAARAMAAAGVDLFDVGGMSTAPGRDEVSAETELARVRPLIEALRADPATREIPISIDTYRASVAEKALDAGATMINDISGGTRDPAMLPLVAARQCMYVVMHMRGDAHTMTRLTQYEHSVVAGVMHELEARVHDALRAGVRRWQLIIDPGIGFAKDTAGNLALLRDLAQLNAPGAGTLGGSDAMPRPGAPHLPYASLAHMPLLLGVSRKRFLGHVLGAPDAPPSERVHATMAACAVTLPTGCVDVVRVHDVPAAMETVRVCDAVAGRARRSRKPLGP